MQTVEEITHNGSTLSQFSSGNTVLLEKLAKAHLSSLPTGGLAEITFVRSINRLRYCRWDCSSTADLADEYVPTDSSHLDPRLELVKRPKPFLS